MPMERVDRAVAEHDTESFVKVVHEKDATVLGATVVAERAGESIHEWALEISNKLKLKDLASTVHAYPTYSIANQQLASAHSDIRMSSFLAPAGPAASRAACRPQGLQRLTVA